MRPLFAFTNPKTAQPSLIPFFILFPLPVPPSADFCDHHYLHRAAILRPSCWLLAAAVLPPTLRCVYSPPPANTARAAGLCTTTTKSICSFTLLLVSALCPLHKRKVEFLLVDFCDFWSCSDAYRYVHTVINPYMQYSLKISFIAIICIVSKL